MIIKRIFHKDFLYQIITSKFAHNQNGPENGLGSLVQTLLMAAEALNTSKHYGKEPPFSKF